MIIYIYKYIFGCTRYQHSAFIPHFHFSGQGVHFSTCFLSLACPDPRRPRPRPCPSRGGVCKKLKRRPYPLDGAASLSLHYPCKRYTLIGTTPLPHLHIFSDLDPARDTPSTLSTLHALEHLI